MWKLLEKRVAVLIATIAISYATVHVYSGSTRGRKKKGRKSSYVADIDSS